jgi:plasmid stabilization system protein ParE
MQVRWSIPPAEDLEHICEWIKWDNPEAGRRIARRSMTNVAV